MITQGHRVSGASQCQQFTRTSVLKPCFQVRRYPCWEHSPLWTPLWPANSSSKMQCCYFNTKVWWHQGQAGCNHYSLGVSQTRTNTESNAGREVCVWTQSHREKTWSAGLWKGVAMLSSHPASKRPTSMKANENQSQDTRAQVSTPNLFTPMVKEWRARFSGRGQWVHT